ncbi:PAS domain S-box-containing protein [Halogranum gelatinilyticum]|uniref:PAS domain S-box-containing protein n=1 Tax=Halogranum gelatinilyticum TaxID=660521 RepID=A0A1G9UC67_9EURY|nr:PAS domain-containing protein [Halogranum gelatinilyticum]SDM57508.1 PAS domain S-box-containing protein [Halogranum gelatinilyticum]
MHPWQSGDIAPFGDDERAIRVLVVDDDEAMADLSATFLERELDALEATALTDPTAVLDELADREYDCLVSDYDMPDLDGLGLLECLREADVSIPFVLFTGKGSEEIASKAISAGVDEYLQKGGTEEYPVLAKQVANLVEKHRAEKQVRRSFLAIESAQEGIGILDENGVYRYMNEAYASVYGRDRADLVGSHWGVLYPESEARRFEEEILPELVEEGTWRGISTGIAKDGRMIPEQLVLTQMDDGGHVCIVRDLTAEGAATAGRQLESRALDVVAVGVHIVDTSADDEPIVYVNDAFRTMAEASADDLVGTNWRTRYDDGEQVDRMASAMENGESVVAEPVLATASTGQFRVQVELTPIRDDGGTVTHVVAAHTDVTKRPPSAASDG